MSDEFIAKKIIEGLLFLSKDPLSVKDIKNLTGFKSLLISQSLKELEEDYQGRGIQIKALAGAYRMLTSSDIAPYVEKLTTYTQKSSLSRAALETLSIIAYRQPVTRGEIEEIRGVNVDGIVNRLLDLKLIRVQGRAPLPGKPVLYGITKEFLKTFGLNGVEDLPRPDDILSLPESAPEPQNNTEE